MASRARTSGAAHEAAGTALALPAAAARGGVRAISGIGDVVIAIIGLSAGGCVGVLVPGQPRVKRTCLVCAYWYTAPTCLQPVPTTPPIAAATPASWCAHGSPP